MFSGRRSSEIDLSYLCIYVLFTGIASLLKLFKCMGLWTCIIVEGLNKGAGGSWSTSSFSVRISLLCRLSIKIFDLCRIAVNPSSFLYC